MDYQKSLAKEVALIIGKKESEIIDLFEVPKDESMGDFAFPCFTLARDLRKSPQEIATMIQDKNYHSPIIDKILRVKWKHEIMLKILNKSGLLRNIVFAIGVYLLKKKYFRKKAALF